MIVFISFFKGVLGTRFGSQRKLSREISARTLFGSLQVHTGYLTFSLKKKLFFMPCRDNVCFCLLREKTTDNACRLLHPMKSFTRARFFLAVRRMAKEQEDYVRKQDARRRRGQRMRYGFHGNDDFSSASDFTADSNQAFRDFFAVFQSTACVTRLLG